MIQPLILILILGLLGHASLGGADAKGDAPRPLFNVGYQVLDVANPKDGQKPPLTVAVWYPTAAAPSPHTYGGSTKGSIAIDAQPLSGDRPYPLLVFSHGYGGSGIGAAFFTEALAAEGWIVVCPDHHDRHSAVRIRTGLQDDFNRHALLQHAKEIAASHPDDRDAYLYRLDEMQLALDGILAAEPLGRLVDRDRIAVGGHSFGGFTALGLCGTIAARHDQRIKAVVLFSTGAGGYLFRDEELAAVRIPSILLMGEREEEQRRGTETMLDLSMKIHGCLPPPTYFFELKGAGHFSFNNALADTRAARLLSGADAEFTVIRRYAIAFLEKHVTGREDADEVLRQPHPMLARVLRTLSR